MKKLIVLDYASATVHVYDIDPDSKDLHEAAEEIIIANGHELGNVHWMTAPVFSLIIHD